MVILRACAVRAAGCGPATWARFLHPKSTLAPQSLRRTIYSKQQGTATTQAQVQPPPRMLKKIELASRIASLILTSGVVFVLYSVYKRYMRRQEFQAQCTDTPQIKNAEVSLVRYKDCVLPESFVMSGMMAELEALETRPGDVLVAGFPRSGSIWLQEVIYLLKNPAELAAGDDKSSDLSDEAKLLKAMGAVPGMQSMDVICPYLEYSYPGLKDIAKREGSRMLKTHLPRHLLPRSVEEGRSAKVLFIHRNPKDVTVSYYHFSRALTTVRFRGSFDRFAKHFMKGELPYSPYYDHLEGYLNFAEERPQQCLAVALEDVVADPKREIRRVAAFLGVKATDADVDKIAEMTTLEAMRGNVRTNGSHLKDWGVFDKSQRSAVFIRDGSVGQHSSHFKDKYVIDAFDKWIQENRRGQAMAAGSQ